MKKQKIKNDYENGVLIGTVSIISSFIFGLLGIILGIIGICYSMKKENKKHFDISAGIIMCTIGIVIAIIKYIIIGIVLFFILKHYGKI